MPTIPKQESQNVEFKESWNDGFRNAGLADPVIEEDEGGIRITLFRPAWVARELGAAFVAKKTVGAESGAESGAEADTMKRRILSFLFSLDSASVSEIAKHNGLTTPSGSMKRIVRSILASGLIERTIPDKPHSRLQKYRLTAKGRAALANLIQ